MSKNEKKQKGHSVQQLIGIKTFTKSGIKVGKDELYFFAVAPTNISVLSAANIEGKIRQMRVLLSSVPDIEVSCTDSSECFDDNKAHPNHGTSVEALAGFLLEIGYRVTYHADTTPLFATLEEFQSYVIQQIDSGTPIMVNWVDWSGHWQTIIGIDTCDTDSPYDDVLIVADSYDVTDHSSDTLKGIIYTEHPDTHVKLQGYTIPYVKEAVEMVLKAATITPQIRYVGWDVATTPTGPAIIEGNTYCAHDFWQLPPHTPDGIGMLPKIKEYIPEFFEGKIK